MFNWQERHIFWSNLSQNAHNYPEHLGATISCSTKCFPKTILFSYLCQTNFYRNPGAVRTIASNLKVEIRKRISMKRCQKNLAKSLVCEIKSCLDFCRIKRWNGARCLQMNRFCRNLYTCSADTSSIWDHLYWYLQNSIF